MKRFGETNIKKAENWVQARDKTTNLLTINYSAVDPLYFEIAIAYLDYVYEVYGLEAQARKIDSTITQMNVAADSNLIEVYNDIELLKKAQSYVSGSRGADLLREGRDVNGRGAGAVRDTKTAEMNSGLFGKAIDSSSKAIEA